MIFIKYLLPSFWQLYDSTLIKILINNTASKSTRYKSFFKSSFEIIVCCLKKFIEIINNTQKVRHLENMVSLVVYPIQAVKILGKLPNYCKAISGSNIASFLLISYRLCCFSVSFNFLRLRQYTLELITASSSRR